MHNFSLLHDDLMDGDEQRRHRDTVWKVHGPAQAILVGDALFALANEVLLELGTVEAGRATRRLTTATRNLIDGQAQDISYEHRERVTVEECLEMEGNKTGALLACACSIGAVLGGADDRTADTLEEYGYHLGLAFQAVDDLLGIWGDPESTGKQTWSDLRQRKKSLPVVAALAAGGPASERLGELLAADAKSSDFENFSEEEFAARAALIEEAGGRDWTAQEARRQHAIAIEALDAVHMPDRRPREARRARRTSSSYGRDDHYRSNTTRVVAGRCRAALEPRSGTRHQRDGSTAERTAAESYHCTKGKP